MFTKENHLALAKLTLFWLSTAMDQLEPLLLHSKAITAALLTWLLRKLFLSLKEAEHVQ
jgi:hypothetical protein